MKFKSFLTLVFISIGYLAQLAEASQFKRLSLDEIVQEADLIVEGKVIDMKSHWSEKKTMIYTDVFVEIAATEKGHTAEKTIKLRLIGGQVDNIQMFIVGGPSFEMNENMLLCLQQVEPQDYAMFLDETTQAKLDGAFHPVGFGQGKFVLQEDAVYGKMAHQAIDGMDFTNKANESLQLDMIPLSSLKESIQGALKKHPVKE